MRRSARLAGCPLAALTVSLVAAIVAGCADPGPSSPGSVAESDAREAADVLGVLDLSGKTVDPFRDHVARATVFLFTRTDCPISNRYAPEVRRLTEQFTSRGAKFYLVYPDRDESAQAIRDHLDQYGYTCPALRDPEHRLVGKSGATVTPEAAVFAPDGRLAYHGRIDDRFADFGKVRAAPTERNLAAALEAVLAGKPVEPASVKAVGCPIPPL